MKLKYKKIILLTTMSTMGIGLLTLSVTQDNLKANDNIDNVATVEASLLKEKSSDEVSLLSQEVTGEVTEGVADESMAVSMLSSEPTAIPTPTPIPVYSIEPAGTYPELDALFSEYYKAKNNCELDKLKQLLSNPAEVDSQEDLQKKTEYIEEYTNIQTYVKKSLEEGSFIVYVYSEIKFTGVNTPAPQLSKFYVITDSDSKLKIFSDPMEGDLAAYFDERDMDQDVVEIINMTNEAGEEAKKKDEDLLNFWKKIDEIASNQNNAQAEGDSAE